MYSPITTPQVDSPRHRDRGRFHERQPEQHIEESASAHADRPHRRALEPAVVGQDRADQTEGEKRRAESRTCSGRQLEIDANTSPATSNATPIHRACASGTRPRGQWAKRSLLAVDLQIENVVPHHARAIKATRREQQCNGGQRGQDRLRRALDAITAPHVGPGGAIVVTQLRHDRRPRLAVLDPKGEVTRTLDLDAVDLIVDPRWLADGWSSSWSPRPRARRRGSDPSAAARDPAARAPHLRRRAPGGGRLAEEVGCGRENRWGASAIVRIGST